MFRLLIILGAMLYGVLLIGGEDRGQLRIGLREGPPPEAPPTDAMQPAPAMAATVQPERPLPASVELALATLPAQPIRIGPAPARLPREETTPLPEAEADPTTAPGTTLRWVAVERANVRQAPSRQSSVTGRVEQGEALLVLWTEPSGWARVRTEGDGVDGFVHESLLTDTDPTR